MFWRRTLVTLVSWLSTTTSTTGLSYSEHKMATSDSQQTNLPEDNSEIYTLMLAKQEREKQGPLEAEYSYGGEADLHKHLARCDKNPGHHKFIPVDQFNVDSLPPDYRNDQLVDFVRALSDVTVRVSVSYVSDKRPETIPDSDKPYPGYSHRGMNMTRVGTGWLCGVFKLPVDSYKIKTCICKECLNSPTPKTQFCQLQIRTATHVVYDKEEGEHTTCHLFFDRGGTPENCSGVVTLSGMSEVQGAESIDYCNMYYYTHDLDLIDRLDRMLEHTMKVHNVLRGNYRNYLSRIPIPPTPAGQTHETSWSTLTVIVSHPHGCSKQVSVGHCTNSKERKDENDLFIYTTATCPGSSGAFVFVLGNTSNYLHMYRQIHSGNSPDSKELNYSGLGYGYLPAE